MLLITDRQSVKNVLACDEGEDQIQMMNEEGHTPLQIASQNKDLQIFEFLLESLICSQVSPSVTLPPCSGHQQISLLASIVKVLSKKEIDIDYSTLYWIMASCQVWKIPRVVCATPTTVLTMAVLEIDLFWSHSIQLMEYSAAIFRGKKKMNASKTTKQETQEDEIPCKSVLIIGKTDPFPELHVCQPNQPTAVADFSSTRLHQLFSDFQAQAGPHSLAEMDLDSQEVNASVQVSSVVSTGNSCMPDMSSQED